MKTGLLRLREHFPLALDAVLVTNETNIRYLSDFSYTDGFLIVCRDRAWAFADSRYSEAAKKSMVAEFTVLPLKPSTRAELSSFCAAQGIRALGYEDGAMTCRELRRWQESLNGITMLPVDRLIDDLRQQKDDFEIAQVIRAQRIAEQAFDHILGFITEEKTEIEIAAELDYTMRKSGADGSSFDTIAVSGSASSLPHGVPRPVKSERGFLTMDFGAVYRGYCSDMTRTVCLGQPSAEMLRVYDTVLQAQLAAIEAIKPGASCREIDRIARNIISKAGYGDCFGHGLGHGVGLEIHEGIRLSPTADEKDVLLPGHIVTVEPGIYLEGRFGVRIEDMMVLGEHGATDITLAPKQLIIL